MGLEIIAPLLVQYGPLFVADLLDLFQSKPAVTGDDFRALHAKYGSKSAADYLAAAQAALPAPVAMPAPVQT